MRNQNSKVVIKFASVLIFSKTVIILSKQNKPFVQFQDLGLIDYEKAWDHQTQVHQALIDIKLQNRDLAKEGQATIEQQHSLIFCEHPPVYTLGKSGSLEHLLLDESALDKGGFSFHKINRGGDITYHGPGQMVGYPIFDLDCFMRDVHIYVRLLEEIIIKTLAEYDIKGIRIEKYTGVWIEPINGNGPFRKIAAIGVHLSRWVTLHGFALNVQPTLGHFGNIIPCGISDESKDVTSMAKELGREVSMNEVKDKLKKHFKDVFEFEWV